MAWVRVNLALLRVHRKKELKKCGVQEMENMLTKLFSARQRIYIYIAFYLIVKYFIDGQMMIVNDRNMQLFLSKC